MRIITFLAALALTAQAHAADIFTPQEQPAFDQPYSFSGPYIGLGVGLGMRNHDISISPLSFDGVGADGPYGEIFLGWQHQFQNNWLLGIEGAITYDDITTEAGIAGAGSLEAKHKNNLTYLAGVKVGRTVTERALLYVMPYWRWMEMDVNITGAPTFNQSYDGPGAQIGLDVAATDNFIVSVYGRGTFYGDENWGVTGLDVGTNELEAGARVSFKSNPLFGR